MDKFVSKVKATIAARGLLRRQGPVLVALSGGADSVALLSVLLQLGYDCVAMHCNFHLRGEESNRDMRSVQQLTERLGVDLYVKDFDVAARRNLTGESLEMACRELRYQWFFELLDRDRAQAIAVGHHREDQVETFFLNLLRGSGLAGLSGMRHRNEHIVRPLLDVSRREIEDYLTRQGLTWVVDSTNNSDEFARNRLRLRLLPMLEELFPGATDSVLKSMAILRESSDFQGEAVDRTIKPYMHDGEIDLASLIEHEPSAPLLLFETLKSEGFNRSQTDDMLQAARNQGGSFIARHQHQRDVDHGILRAPHAGREAEADSVEVSLRREIFTPVHILVSEHHVSEFIPENDVNVAYIDLRAMEGAHRWHLRPWHRGDRMKPFGMTGTKLLSDIFAAAKLSSRQKENVYMLTRDDEIIWAVGLRASAHFTIAPGTKRYLRLQYMP